ncbi:unnamed protein product [Mytilus coruscus]|uniref:Mab-21-like nucleotidyltransferase domain-containing protein n=1 Tax=Mytilus coruscus TaxID=42192 RepID=A0A6J8ABE2_MYTCO|nr:unnamed protein product [Mytilus coruscus]
MHEQSISNIRFPDKTSNEYLEYLESCEFKLEGHDSEFSLKEKCRYQRLQKIVGTEKAVRSRQRLLKLNDYVDNNADLGTTKLSSGSLAEGLDLPGSDIDIMYIVHNIDVVQDVKEVYRSGHATFLMEKCNKYPGFAKLKLVTKHKACVSFLIQTETGIYFSSQRLMKFLRGTKNNMQIHGPCLSDPYQHEDIAFCLRSRIWPREAVNWIYRRRRWQWPSDGVVEKQNLFKGKINTSNNKTLLSVFTDMKYHGMEALVHKVLSSNDIVTFSPVVEQVERDEPFKLEILFYKILLTTIACFASSNGEILHYISSIKTNIVV